MAHTRLGIAALAGVCAAVCVGAVAGCGSAPTPAAERTDLLPAEDARVPESTRAWMQRLTVPTGYDPGTGFIVARRVTPLPPVLAMGPSLEEAVARGRATGTPVVAFATADRCGPCQQFKLDALSDPRVVRRLERGDLIAAHIEIDREPVAADAILGSRGIPVSYRIEGGAVVARLAGQRSADELLAWLDGAR